MTLRSIVAGAALAAALTATACRTRSTRATLPHLPEDADAGAQAVAQWRQHMNHEERERRLNYDRRKLPEHRRVLHILRQARRNYDGAHAAATVRTVEAQFRTTSVNLEKAFQSIDHWGVNSKVVPEYRRLVSLLSDSYPGACIQAISGDKSLAEATNNEFDKTLTSINDWLEAAAESEDE